MQKINLYCEKQTSATSVSNIFIDEYMSEANGEFVKIYLYLLRQLNSSDAKFSLSEIADKFEHTEKDVKRALCYWERMQLLHLDYDSNSNLIGIQLLDAHSKADKDTANTKTVPVTRTPSAASADAMVSSVQTSVPEKKSYSADTIKQFTETESVQELLFITEQYLGRPLTITDLNTIYYWHDDLKLSTELIEYLIEYSISNEHSSIHYMNKIAIEWHKHGINTVESAKQTNVQFNRSYATVMKHLGITKRSLVPAEMAYIDTWKNDYGFTMEMILAACDKTIASVNRPNFAYTDKILTDWKAANIRTLPDIAKYDSTRQNRKKASAAVKKAAGNNAFNNFDQRVYDNEQLEKMLFAGQS